jgi:hypothetical protein
MKQLFLPVLAFVFTGNFADVDAACNSAIPGSGKNLKEVEQEGSSQLTLAADSKGNAQTLNPGDALIVVNNPDGTPLGFDMLPAHIASTLVSEVPAAAATS